MTITLNLDDELSRATQEMAEERHATVDEVILTVLQHATADRRKRDLADESSRERLKRWDGAMAKLAHFDTGGPYTRDEMNER